MTSAVVASHWCSTTGRGPGQRADDELVAALQAAGPQVVGEHPHAVAAHLRDRAVGVAVVHVPVVGARHPREAGRRHPPPAAAPAVVTRSTPSAPRPRRRSHSAATAAGVSVEPAVRVGQQHEIVLRAVALGELHLLRIRARHTRSVSLDVVGRGSVEPGDAVVAAEPRPLPCARSGGCR